MWRDRAGQRGRLRKHIKIRDDGPHRQRWIPLARHRWLTAGRAIPEGSFIVHADGNAMNCHLANLRCVDRRGHLALQFARNPEHLAKCRRNAAAAQQRRWERHRAMTAARDEALAEAVTWWECGACAADVHTRRRPERCAHCGGGAFVRRRAKRRAI